MHMYIRISIWIRKPSLDQELKPKKKTNALKVGNTFCKYCIRKGLRKKKKGSRFSFRFRIQQFSTSLYRFGHKHKFLGL